MTTMPERGVQSYGVENDPDKLTCRWPRDIKSNREFGPWCQRKSKSPQYSMVASKVNALLENRDKIRARSDLGKLIFQSIRSGTATRQRSEKTSTVEGIVSAQREFASRQNGKGTNKRRARKVRVRLCHWHHPCKSSFRSYTRAIHDTMLKRPPRTLHGRNLEGWQNKKQLSGRHVLA